MVAINGTKLTSWDQERRRSSRRRPARRCSLTIERDGVQQVVSHHPGRERQVRQRDRHKLIPAGYIGRRPDQPHLLRARVDHRRCRVRSAASCSQAVDALGSYPSKIGSLWQTVFDGKPRDPNGAVGVVGLGEIGGQVADSNQVDGTAKIYSLLEPAGQRQPAAVLLQPAAAAAARRRACRRRAGRGGQAGTGAAARAPRRCRRPRRRSRCPDAFADLRRHGPDAAGDVRRRVRPDRVDAAGRLRRHRQADPPAQLSGHVTGRSPGTGGYWRRDSLSSECRVWDTSRPAGPEAPPVLAPRRISRQIKVGSVAGRRRRADLGPVDGDDADLRRQRDPAADRRADRGRLRHRPGRRARRRTTPTRCPRSRSTRRSR